MRVGLSVGIGLLRGRLACRLVESPFEATKKIWTQRAAAKGYAMPSDAKDTC